MSAMNNQIIEFEIAGGLGNQLFMLCAGICLQEKVNRPVCFDISDLQRISNLHPGHNILTLGLLDNYTVLDSNKDKEHTSLVHKIVSNAANWISMLNRHLGLNRTFIAPEIGYTNLDKIPLRTRKIKGYFQSYRYISEVSDRVIRKIESIDNLSDWYFSELQQLKGRKFAAFHIRRGDYSLAINRKTGMLSLEYFESIANLLPHDIEVLIFTDGVEEIERRLVSLNRNFRIVNPPFNSDPIESLLLMSKASHIAISNSTYSWWAAFLSSPETTVFAPDKWFEFRQDPKDLIPESWTRIRSDWEVQS